MVMSAVAAVPVPPSREVGVTLLWAVPATVPWTFTVKLHELLLFRVAPLRLMVPLPAMAVTVPLQVLLVNPFGVATISLPGDVGKVSVKPTCVKLTLLLGFVMVKVRLVVPFSGI